MLINASNHTIDTKGRISFPVRFREDMWDDIVMCRGREKYIMLFSRQEWTHFTDGFKTLVNSQAEVLRYYFMSIASEGSVDAQGRLLLPQNLRQFAGLEKDIVITGMQNHAEIWSADEWNKKQAAVETMDIAALLDKIPGGFGL